MEALFIPCEDKNILTVSSSIPKPVGKLGKNLISLFFNKCQFFADVVI